MPQPLQMACHTYRATVNNIRAFLSMLKRGTLERTSGMAGDIIH